VCSFCFDTVLYGVESGEGSSKSLVGGFVVHVGELERSDRLRFEDLNTSLERLGEHEVLVERVLEDSVVEGLLFVLVLVGSGSLILSALVDDLPVLEISISDVFTSLFSGECILLSLLVVGKVELLFLHSVIVRGLILECVQISRCFLFLFVDRSLLLSGLFTDIIDGLSKVLVKFSDGCVVVSFGLGHADVLLLLELLELTVDIHLNQLSLLMHLFSVLSLHIGEDRS